ncbi:MAG: cell division protein FtsL [Desulfobacterales bacterium]|nr:MAG: cell division protein FtsL [Desulfobacterales bacterium]
MVRKNHIPAGQSNGLKWFVLILVLICELMAHTWIRSESTQAILRISNAQFVLQKRLSDRKELNLELERLNGDDRITGIARTRLEMSSDTSDQTFYLTGKTTITGTLKTPCPLTGAAN